MNLHISCTPYWKPKLLVQKPFASPSGIGRWPVPNGERCDGDTKERGLNLPPRRVALHAARIGGGAAAAAFARGRGEPAFRPGGADLDRVATPLQLLARIGGHPAFDHEH